MVKLKIEPEKFQRLEKSRHYYRRKKHMKELHVPGIGETRRELGDEMADIIFDQCPEPMKPVVGLVPNLEGAGDELWVSPSDLLIPKVCLKPPLTNKYIKALTHEGILLIGEDIDRRYWLQMENEKNRALEDQRELIMRIAEMERKVAIKLAREEERDLAAAYIKNLMDEFETRLAEELKNLEDHMLELQDQAVKEAVEQCDLGWRSKIEDAINDVVQQMSEQYAEDLEKEKQELEAQFRMELHKQNTEFNYALKHEQEFCKMTLKQLRHCLECKNLANLMYVLCMERRKCTIEKCAMEYVYKNQISELENTIQQKDADIRRLTEEKDRKQRQLDIREEVLLEILKEFQKFINFALRAVPTQAEFLLSVQKMILYEVAKQTWQPGLKKPLKHLCKKIFSWKSDSKLTEPTPKYDLEPKDYHKCLDEVEPKQEELDESDVLPYFYYNDKLYVRGDMEYFFDHGIQISETNLLWNKDVDNLMQILTTMKPTKIGDDVDGGPECKDKLKVIEEEKEKEIAAEEEEEKEEEQDDEIASLHSKEDYRESRTSRMSYPKKPSKVASGLKPAMKPLFEGSAVTDILSSTSPPMYETPADNTGILAAQDSLSTIRMSRRSSFRGVQPVQQAEIVKTLSAINESAIQADRESTKNKLNEGGTVSFEHFQAIRILDEIELTKPSNRSSRTSLAKPRPSLKPEKESILQKKPITSKSTSNSRLLHTTDSLIIHRNSLTIGHKMLESVQKQQQQQQQQQQPPSYRSHGSLISKLSFTRDSLELLRKHSFHSKRDVKKEGDTASLDNTILLTKAASKQLQVEEKYEKVKKVVSPLTVSHIEVAKIPTDIKEGDVKFSPIHEVYETNVLKTADSPWNIYKDEKRLKVESSEEILAEKEPQAEVVGDRKGKEYLETSYRFTDKRINSIMTTLKKDPTLIRLFTRVRN